MKTSLSLRSLLFFMVFFGASCNVSDEGGGITPDCTKNEDCVTGICVDGDCRGVPMDAGNNGMDASNNGVEDAGDDAGGDAGADMTDITDMNDMGPACPEGRVDRNGDESDGCELPAHPAAEEPACEPCWNLSDAVAGCSQGTCQIVACLNGKTDRDGMPMNGCEEDCGPGECWTPISALQTGFTRVADDWIIGSGDGVSSLTRDQGQTVRWFHSENPRDFVARSASDLQVLGDNTLVGIKDNTIVLSDDLGLTWREATLPTAFGATAVTRSTSGRGIAGGFSGTCAVRQCPAETCSADETCVAGVCEGTDCSYESDCSSGSICGANGKCVDPGNIVCLTSSECGGAQCNSVGNRLLVSDDFETWTTSGAQIPFRFEEVFTNSDGSTIMGVNGADVHRTTDDGDTWQTQTLNGCAFARAAAWNSSDRVVLGGAGCLQVSQDDGASFSEASVSGTVDEINSFLWLDDSTVLAGGSDTILKSTDAGLNWTRTDVVGAVYDLERLSDGTVMAFSAYGGVWSSSDDGANWTSVREARTPLPAEISDGDVGIAATGDSRLLLPPSQSDFMGPWTDGGFNGVRTLHQTDFEFFLHVLNTLWWGNDLANITPQPINPAAIDTSQIFIDFQGNSTRCNTSTGTLNVDCDVISNSVLIRVATYNGNTTYAVSRLGVRARIQVFTSTQTATFNYNVLMSSTNKNTWRIVDQNFANPGSLEPTPSGMITPGFYSTSPNSVDVISDARCNAGPFLVREDGAIVSFELPELCLSQDGGASWSILAASNDFTERRGNPRSPVVLGGTTLGVLINSGQAAYLQVSTDDGQNWSDLDVRMPWNTSLSSNGTRRLATSPRMLLRGN